MITGSNREYWRNRKGTWSLKTARKDGAILSVSFNNFDDGPGSSTAAWQIPVRRFSALLEKKHLSVDRPSGVLQLRTLTELGGDVEFAPRPQYAEQLEDAGIRPSPRSLLRFGLFDAPFVRFVKSQLSNAVDRDILWLVMLHVPQNYIRDMLRVLPASPSDLGMLYKGNVRVAR
jgi:hypothetical protein